MTEQYELSNILSPPDTKASTNQAEPIAKGIRRAANKVRLGNTIDGRKKLQVEQWWDHENQCYQTHRYLFEAPQCERRGDMVDKAAAATIRAVVLGLQPWPLYLYGEAGSGKTCASLCLGDFYGFCAYATVPDLHRATFDDQFRVWCFGANGSAAFMWVQWKRANVVILDEIGTRAATDGQYETVKRAIDYRIDDGKPLIVIGNKPPKDLVELYDDRIASRVASGTVVKFEGDRRIAK